MDTEIPVTFFETTIPKTLLALNSFPTTLTTAYYTVI